MPLDRRQLLAASGALLGSCRSGARGRPNSKLDTLLAAHADALPERAGAGANHYPMAAEALDALGYGDAIGDDWLRGSSLYAGPLTRVAPIADSANTADDSRALGAYERFADWLDYFRRELERKSWPRVVEHWAPRLAPGLAGATFHGLLRTSHAVRALSRHETPARRGELAVGLAYWAARYTELPAGAPLPIDESLHASLARLEYPWLHDATEVDFSVVLERLTNAPIAPAVSLESRRTSPAADLETLVHEAEGALLEMLVQERQRIWLLHTVTGPAAIGLLLPVVDETGARRLVEYARQAVVGLYAAYGAPYVARAHVRSAPPAWRELVEQAAATRSVHTIKLIEALTRFDRAGDPLARTVAAQWLEWR